MGSGGRRRRRIGRGSQKAGVATAGFFTRLARRSPAPSEERPPRMRVHLVNPSDVSFGTAVITPRWLYVLAAATPDRVRHAAHRRRDARAVRRRSVASRATSSGSASTRPTRFAATPSGSSRARRGAFVVFGGIHATLFPDEVREHGAAHAVVTGDGDMSGRTCSPIARPARRRASTTAAGSRERRSRPRAGTCCRPTATCGARCRRSAAARSTARSARCGAPTGRSRASVRWPLSFAKSSPLRRKGFRFVAPRRRQLLSRDAGRSGGRGSPGRQDAARVAQRPRQERFELMAQLERLPEDMVFYTQITMEAAEDPEFLAAMRRARIRGALVGVESVTPEGLKAVFKNFNDAGEALVTRLQAFRSERRPRARVVHLRPADRYAGHVRRDRRSRATRRRHVRAVRDADAVSRHRRLRQVGTRIGGRVRSWTAFR